MIYTREVIQKKKQSKEKRSKILRTIMYIIFVPITIYNVILIVQSVFNPHTVPSFMGIKNFVIISGSMEPNLNIGDIVVVKDVDSSKIDVGDVISFRCGQTVITHRVTEKSKDENGMYQYITKGDNNNAEDGNAIEEELVEGKVVFVIRKLGTVAVTLQNKVILLIVMLIFLFSYLNNSRKQEKRRKRKLKRLAMEAIKLEMEGKLFDTYDKKEKKETQQDKTS